MNTFHATMSDCSTAACIASRFACRSPTFGRACDCSSTRSSRHRAPATRRASSISDADIGLFSGDRQTGEHDHRRVAPEEHLFHEVVDRVADPGIVLTALLLRKAHPEVARLAGGWLSPVLEEVALDVEHELVARQRGARRVRIGGRGRRDLEAAARLATLRRARRFVGARVQRQERGRRTAHRQEKLATRDSEAPRVPVAIVACATNSRLGNGRERRRVEFAVRARPELDRQTRVARSPVRCAHTAPTLEVVSRFLSILLSSPHGDLPFVPDPGPRPPQSGDAPPPTQPPSPEQEHVQ